MASKAGTPGGQVTIYDRGPYVGRPEQLDDADSRLPTNGLSDPSNNIAWVDVPGSAQEGAGAAGLTQQDYPENGSPFQALFMSHNVNETLSFASQMPHGWDLGQVRPHVHVEPAANPAVLQVARFTMRYTWSQVGKKTPLLVNWPTLVATINIAPGEDLVQKVVNFGLIDPPSNAEASNILLWVVTRTGTDAGDTYDTNKTWQIGAANLVVHSFDVHCRVVKAGSFPEFIP